MTITSSWQEDLTQALQQLLADDPDVLALALFGSCIRANRDTWSDVDALIVLQDAAVPRYYPATTRFLTLGKTLAEEHSTGSHSATTRLCFTDFRRLDLIFVTATAFNRIDEWPRVPFWNGCRVLFSRSPAITQRLDQRYATPELELPTREQFQAMAEQFWFKAALAVVKVVRDDQLIALHLALDLLRDCCVLEMLLRDRATGTNHHRHGGIGNQFVAELEAGRFAYTPDGILEGIARSATLFDTLAAQWSPAWVARQEPLRRAIVAARQEITRRP